MWAMGRMIQKHKFVEQNIDMLRKLTKEGYMSSKLLTNYNVFKLYISIKDNSQMKRYKAVASEMQMSVVAVRKAVYDMKKYVTC